MLNARHSLTSDDRRAPFNVFGKARRTDGIHLLPNQRLQIKDYGRSLLPSWIKNAKATTSVFTEVVAFFVGKSVFELRCMMLIAFSKQIGTIIMLKRGNNHYA